METHESSTPPPDDAQRMLNSAREAEHLTRNPPLPWHFFVVQSALMAAVCLGQMLPPKAALLVTMGGLAAVLVMGIRFVFYRRSYGAVFPDTMSVAPYMFAMLLTVGIPAVLALALEISALWVLAAICAALTTLEMGRRYRKAVRRG